MSKKISRQYGILIIEDDVAVRKTMARILTRHGFMTKEVGLASDAAKAIDESIDLLLVDIGLPDYDGQNLVMRLRRRYDKKRLKICFVSSLSEKETIQKSIEVGGDDYLIKPVDRAMLVHKVSGLLGRATDDFAWVGVECSAELLNYAVLPDLMVVRISEVGLWVRSSARMLIGSQIHFDSPALSKAIGLPFGEISQRVNTCEKIRGSSYFIGTEFVGLSEQYARPLRSLAIRGQYITEAQAPHG